MIVKLFKKYFEDTFKLNAWLNHIIYFFIYFYQFGVWIIFLLCMHSFSIFIGLDYYLILLIISVCKCYSIDWISFIV